METVRVFIRTGRDRKMVLEAEATMFMEKARLMRREDRYLLDFATGGEGGAEIDLPRSIGKDLVESLLAMLPDKERYAILKAAAERM